eukprot:4573345-Pyramimonas_sp.AAC.1
MSVGGSLRDHCAALFHKNCGTTNTVVNYCWHSELGQAEEVWVPGRTFRDPPEVGPRTWLGRGKCARCERRRATRPIHSARVTGIAIVEGRDGLCDLCTWP